MDIKAGREAGRFTTPPGQPSKTTTRMVSESGSSHSNEPTNDGSGDHEEDDDKDEDDAWEPVLAVPQMRSSMDDGRNAAASSSQWSTLHPSRRRLRPGNESQQSSDPPPRPPLPPNCHVKGALIDRPLQVLGRSFGGHLVRELWDSDLRFRLAVLCLVASAVSHALLMSYASAWTTLRAIRPTLALLLLLGAPLLYLHPAILDAALFQVTAALSSSPWDWMDRMGASVEVRHVRAFFLVLLLLPTVLEIYVLHALAQAILMDSSWLGVVVAVLAVVVVLFAASRSWGKGHHSSPHECLRAGWLTLLALAWIRSLSPFSGRRLLALSPPLFAGLAALLLQQLLLDDNQNDEDDGHNFASRAVRKALRRALRDAFEAVGSAVRGDEGELLQLAVLRWIVDYWATTSTTMPQQTTTPTNASSRPSSSPASDRPGPPPPTTASSSDLTWGELLPMLSVATDQMQLEVRQLHEAHEGAEEAPLPSPTPTPTPRISRSDSNTRANPRSSSSSSAFNSHIPPPHFENLQSMLAHMDLDGRAEPAVMAYKLAVHSFPPSMPTAVLWATARRCPALLAVVLGMLGLLSNSSLVHWLAEVLLLIPLVAVELWRLRVWSEHCQAAAPHFSIRSTSSDPNPCRAPDDCVPLEMADPMLLLLSDDAITAAKPPTLLRVWRNVRASVPALEAGLTAARCAQTTAAAAEFAIQLQPLVDLGVRINEHGWWYGWSVLLKELLALHAINASETSSSIPRSAAAPHIDAALQAVGHSRTVARNLRVLATAANGDGDGPAMDPLWALLAAVVGRGWLWDRQGLSAPASTVTIEEVFDNEGQSAPPPPLVHDSRPAVEGSATNVFGVQLRDHVNASEAEYSSRDQEVSRLDRLSEVMETVAACAEQRLLNDVRASIRSSHLSVDSILTLCSHL